LRKCRKQNRWWEHLKKSVEESFTTKFCSNKRTSLQLESDRHTLATKIPRLARALKQQLSTLMS
jgi:hypothetical protein